ncbi:DNA repair exonuclease SbcCD ATPase subunit [Salinihabitans flavidus]|uniref:DNA repair exonuclease SbcCD ATPase subunit n=1 Tax=Salinihabitans flavidus TaxID=569882 RepID=A0A1H8PJ65_9RHOB|nr:AAA family ATPase [Salinihabitans flavidus]SEO41846.1 DNA repair exonuclease SbcCD ATPase subunit [Salinihabitans flavidus]
MNLLSVRLNNVRRFTAPVEITGLGPGLNVLSAPNEQGKSTIFDALHALFFKSASSRDKEIRALIPHAGGDPEITAEIAQDGARYRIEKIFSKGTRAGTRILRDGHLYKQAGEAEAWLDTLLTAPRDGGPAGLLWVRQGLTAFQDAGATLDARRDLLSSVAGEVEAVTGGRQMEAIRAQVRTELDRYVTRTGRTAKNGPLAEAETQVEELQELHGSLADKAADLRGLLDSRRVLVSELDGLRDAQEAAHRTARLDEARKAHQHAESHLERLDRATSAVDTAEARVQRNQQSLETLTAQLREVMDAEKALTGTGDDHRDAADRLTRADTALAAARQAETTARKTLDTAHMQLDRVIRAEAARIAETRRAELTARLSEAEAHHAEAEKTRALVARGPDAAVMDKIETAAADLSFARRAREAASASVSMSYSPGGEGGVTLEGTPLQDGARLPLPDGGALHLRGLGELRIHPGTVAGDEDLQQADTTLRRALEEAGFSTLDNARAAHRERAEAKARLDDAVNALRIAAPDGIDALRARISDLPRQEPDTGDLPTRDQAEAELQEAKARHAETLAGLEKARAEHASAQATAQGAGAAHDGATARLERAAAALRDRDGAEARLTALRTEAAELRAALDKARREKAALADSAPDPEQTQAALQRATSAAEAVQTREQEITRDLAGLDARIDVQAGQAIEEELAEAEGRLATAQARLDSLRFEVDVLRTLDQTLDTAQQSARDHYIGPIFRELEPLVRMVWPDAELHMDADSVLPSRLVRPGAEDTFDQLSGGTQEQIALLVRLAFARLLARAGTPAPVILDDAIVYTDDDRIEKMFDALTRQASDLQIIVFSCRQRAFRDLGGRLLSIRPAHD